MGGLSSLMLAPFHRVPVRKSYPDVVMVARAVGSCGGNNGRTEASSHSGEPTVSAIFPKKQNGPPPGSVQELFKAADPRVAQSRDRVEHLPTGL